MSTDIQKAFDSACYSFYENNRSQTLLSLALAGSHGYGTATKTSDFDFRGVFVGNAEELLGFKGGVTSIIQDKDGKDNHFWEIRHFFKMCAQGNPNVIETLWAKDYCIYNDYSGDMSSPLVGQSIRDIRDRFLSRRLGRTYLGYAISNWKRAVKINGKEDWASGFEPTSVTINWKDLMHLIRLIRTGREVLETGVFRPRRDEDRELFLRIKAGQVPLGDLEVEFKAAKDTWDDLIAKSPLPEEPDEDYLNRWLTKYLTQRLVFLSKADRKEYADE